MSFVLKLRTIFINNVCTRKLKKEKNHVLQKKKKLSHIGLFTLVIHLFCRENYCLKCESKTVFLIKKYNQKGSISYNEK